MCMDWLSVAGIPGFRYVESIRALNPRRTCVLIHVLHVNRQPAVVHLHGFFGGVHSAVQDFFGDEHSGKRIVAVPASSC